MTLGELLIKVGTDLSDLDSGLNDAVGRIEQGGRRLSAIGQDLTVGLTAPILALGVGSLKAAADFEQAMTGVAKTTDLTDTELAELSEQFKEMSNTMPIAATGLARVGEAAGQLGIESENILGFTRVMADMGVATNLSADEAATAMARLANITKMPQTEFDRLGSTIVALGNAGASTEREIVEMGLRIAGAGTQVGLTNAEILAFANALSSVGIEAEMGGSAISKTFIEIASSVATGGKSLRLFAQTAGTTTEAFRKQFQEDAAGAMISFIEGLGKMDKQSGQALLTLEKLGISEIRQRDALLRAAGAGDLFRESLTLGSRAWEENNALTEEANRFYGTSINQLKALGNQALNVAADFGAALLPILRAFIDVARPIVEVLGVAARAFGSLPTPMQHAIVAFGAVLAAIGPVLFIVGQLAASWAALAAVAAPLGISVAALVAPFLAGAAAFAAVVAAGSALVQNWGIITYEARTFVDAVGAQFQRLIDWLAKLRQPIENVTGWFRNMWDKVVGHSYVPDMVNGIAKHFARLDSVMVQPAMMGTIQVVNAFRKFESASGLVDLALDRQRAAISRIQGLRFDLAIERDADAVEKLRTQLSEGERELGRINKVLAEAKRIADEAAKSFEKLAFGNLGTPEIKITPILDPGRGPRSPTQVPGFGRTQEVIDGFINALSGTDKFLVGFGEHIGVGAEHMLKLSGIVDSVGGVFINVGKSVLGTAGNIFGKLIGMINPLGIVTSVFDQALRNATGKNEQLAAAFEKLVSILVDAFAPVVEAMIPVFEALEPIIRELAPVLAAVAEIFAILFKALSPILAAVIPLLRALFPVFKFLAIIVTYLGQGFTKLAQIVLTISSWIAKAIGFLVRGIGRFLDAIPGLGDFGLRKAGQGLIDMGDAMQDSADEFGRAFDDLGKAREEIRKIELEEPLQKTAGGLNTVTESALGAATALNQLATTDPRRGPNLQTLSLPDDATHGAEAAVVSEQAASTPVTNRTTTVALGGVTIQTSGDGEETYRNFYNTLVEKARAGGTEARELVDALPAP